MGLTIPSAWTELLGPETEKPYFRELEAFLDAERADHTVHPDAGEVFAALDATPPAGVRALLLGQDPYPTPGHAHGLCFSVKPGVKAPGSLLNMYKELRDDLEIPLASTGYLMPWAQQGLLMLNAVLTVRSGAANSHKSKGWEKFTDAIIRAVNDGPPVVFVFWGAYAQKKEKFVDTSKHVVVKGAHPSPLSAKLWFGSRPFSAINDGLTSLGRQPIDWRL